MQSIFDKASAWADGDCDDVTRDEIRALVSAGNASRLNELVGGELAFGTAGLRAKVGAGSLRMNRAVVRRTTKAVADELLAAHPDARSLPVVVGYDARLTSRVFAEDTIAVLAAAGLAVRFFEEPVPTPIVAYALRKYKAVAAIVVTASHNPAEYNGYKLYDSNGAQIISPKDERIAARLATVPRARDIKLATDVFDGGCAIVEPVLSSVVDAYYRDIGALRPTSAPERGLKIVYTPMHGVGYLPVKRAFEDAGFTSLLPVPEQAEPDGNFPTAKFPNPEEAGALDLALALAEKESADIILANDPDADRLAACVRNSKGELIALTGNQIGLLLADYQLSRYQGTSQPLVACSIVSSPMLKAIADKYGAHYEQTFTGFKWVWNAALELREQKDLHFVFGFEEALGYSAEDIVRDKDGISAALLLAEMAAADKSVGSSVYARLEKLYEQHGLWVSVQKSVSCDEVTGRQEIEAAMDKLVANPPESFQGIPVVGLLDFRVPDAARPRWLSTENLLHFDLGDAGRVLVRPSGTEPKLKTYVDLRRDVSSGDVWGAEAPALELARAIAADVLAALGMAD